MDALFSRYEQFSELFPQADAFRWKQAEKALFFPQTKIWDNVTTLPKAMRQLLGTKVPFYSYFRSSVILNSKKDTAKAILQLSDGSCIETVLMENRREQYTICVSSQVGCAMVCRFCATGKMGFTRNLLSDEIVDQYRFWNKFLFDNGHMDSRISNIVFMGMGEPLANYEAVKSALQVILRYTEIGPTHITVSSVGLLPTLERLLFDADWPKVRIAISLHSADLATRKSIVPTTRDDFLEALAVWAKQYLLQHGNRRHHLSFEYIMLSGINDTPFHARKLAAYVSKIGKVKVNLIPYNLTNAPFRQSTVQTLKHFVEILRASGVSVTVRKTMGEDISAACGQLIVKNSHKPVMV